MITPNGMYAPDTPATNNPGVMEPSSSYYDPLRVSAYTGGSMEYMPNAQFMTSANYGAFRTMPMSGINKYIPNQTPSFTQSLLTAHKGFGIFNTYNPMEDPIMRQYRARRHVSDSSTGAMAGLANFGFGMLATLPFGLVGGAVASAVLPDISKGYTDRIKHAREIQNMTMSKIVGGAEVNRETGLGFTGKASYKIDRALRKAAVDDQIFNEGDYKNILKLGMEYGMYDYANSSQQYIDVTKKLSKTLKGVMHIVGSSDFKEILTDLKRLQSMGASMNQFEDIMYKENAFAKIAGLTHKQMVDTYGQSGSMIYAQRGLDAHRGSLENMANASRITIAQRQGHISNSTLARHGGVSGMAQKQTEAKASMEDNMTELLVPYVMDSNGKLDLDKLKELQAGLANGSITYKDLIERKAAVLSDPNKADLFKNTSIKKDIFSQMTKAMNDKEKLALEGNLAVTMGKELMPKASVTSQARIGYERLGMGGDQALLEVAKHDPKAQATFDEQVNRAKESQRQQQDAEYRAQHGVWNEMKRWFSGAKFNIGENIYGDMAASHLAKTDTGSGFGGGGGGGSSFQYSNSSNLPSTNAGAYDSSDAGVSNNGKGGKVLNIDEALTGLNKKPKTDLERLSSLSEKSESANAGGFAAAGKYGVGVNQLNYHGEKGKTTLENFAKYVAGTKGEKGAEFQRRVQEAMKAPDPTKTVPEMWRQAIKDGLVTKEDELAFEKKTHYDPTLKMADEETRKLIEGNSALQQATWSLSMNGIGVSQTAMNKIKEMRKAGKQLSGEDILDVFYDTRLQYYENEAKKHPGGDVAKNIESYRKRFGRNHNGGRERLEAKALYKNPELSATEVSTDPAALTAGDAVAATYNMLLTSTGGKLRQSSKSSGRMLTGEGSYLLGGKVRGFQGDNAVVTSALDCSGAAWLVNYNQMQAANKASQARGEGDVFDQATVDEWKKNTALNADQIIAKIEDMGGKVEEHGTTLDATKLKEGDTIGINYTQDGSGGRKRNIDHVATVGRDKDGNLVVYHNASTGSGIVVESIESFQRSINAVAGSKNGVGQQNVRIYSANIKDVKGNKNRGKALDLGVKKQNQAEQQSKQNSDIIEKSLNNQGEILETANNASTAAFSENVRSTGAAIQAAKVFSSTKDRDAISEVSGKTITNLKDITSSLAPDKKTKVNSTIMENIATELTKDPTTNITPELVSELIATHSGAYTGYLSNKEKKKELDDYVKNNFESVMTSLLYYDEQNTQKEGNITDKTPHGQLHAKITATLPTKLDKQTKEYISSLNIKEADLSHNAGITNAAEEDKAKMLQLYEESGDKKEIVSMLQTANAVYKAKGGKFSNEDQHSDKTSVEHMADFMQDLFKKSNIYTDENMPSRQALKTFLQEQGELKPANFNQVLKNFFDSDYAGDASKKATDELLDWSGKAQEASKNSDYRNEQMQKSSTGSTLQSWKLDEQASKNTNEATAAAGAITALWLNRTVGGNITANDVLTNSKDFQTSMGAVTGKDVEQDVFKNAKAMMDYMNKSGDTRLQGGASREFLLKTAMLGEGTINALLQGDMVNPAQSNITRDMQNNVQLGADGQPIQPIPGQGQALPDTAIKDFSTGATTTKAAADIFMKAVIEQVRLKDPDKAKELENPKKTDAEKQPKAK